MTRHLRFFGFGKDLFVPLQNHSDILPNIKTFYDPDMTKTILYAVGKSFIEAMYGFEPQIN